MYKQFKHIKKKSNIIFFNMKNIFCTEVQNNAEKHRKSAESVNGS